MSLPTSRTARASYLARTLAASAVLCGAAVASVGLTGCQASMAGQTLPSPYYLKDDVQFFPAGPEFQYTNQVRAIEEYQLDAASVSGPAN
ncbi:hypothetical protein [Alienimonas chondri]|uniref:Uncharacterized protein n=1 Tax=Alienimonas chondri TaxID=2681879 RepID=A0ABX1VHJ0_9PLAN|nr:hypothetical protein [Alienimonas chondri]NNJ26717.1 hypothetical protein [Alienimonas chondri]